MKTDSSTSSMCRNLSMAREDLNVIDTPWTDFYGFVYNITTDVDAKPLQNGFDEPADRPDNEADDDPDDLLTAPGRWILDIECLERKWFETVWDEDLRDAVVEKATRDGATAENITEQYPGRAYRLHRMFIDRLIKTGEEAPVSLLHIAIDPDEFGRGAVVEAEWYTFTLSMPRRYTPAASLAEVTTDEGVHTVLAVLSSTTPEDPPPTLRTMLFFSDPRDGRRELLRVLHRPLASGDAGGMPPQGEPQSVLGKRAADPDVRDASNQELDLNGFAEGGKFVKPDLTQNSDDETQPPTPMDEEKPRDPAERRSLFSRLQHATRRFLRWLEPPLPPFAPAGWTLPFPVAPPDDPGDTASRPESGDSCELYIGAPSGGGVNRMANPMVGGGGRQQFVGVLNVGQANCNPIFNHQHRIICYYDFGSPVHNYLATAPANIQLPCLHDDPIMVLSHWDYDHCGMARRNAYSYQMRWIVPQQDMGSASARDIYARIINGTGGQIHLWPGYNNGPPDRHLALPWGFIERGIVRNQLRPGAANINDGGLVMYVCVRDGAAGGGAGPAWPGAFNARAAPVLQSAQARAGLARAAAAGNAADEDITEAATAAAEEVAAAIGVAGPIGGAHIAASATAARQAIANAGVGANWVHAWTAITLIGGGNVISVAAATVNPPLAGGLLGGTRCQATFAANAGLLANANLNAAAPNGRANTARVAAAAAVVDAALAGGNLANRLAAARAAARQVSRNHNVNAVAGAPPAYPPAVPLAPGAIALAVAPGSARTDAGERYILLTGDVGCQHIPSQTAAARPVVVGMTPTHHGAHTCLPTTGSRLRQDIARLRLPWAPGTPAAVAARCAGLAAQSGAFAMHAQNNVLAVVLAAATAYALKEMSQWANRPAGNFALDHLVAAAASAIQNGGVGGRRNLVQLGGGTIGAAGTELSQQVGLGGGTATATVLNDVANNNGMLIAAAQGQINNDLQMVAAVIIADTAAAVLGVGGLPATLEHTAAHAARDAARQIAWAVHANRQGVAPPALVDQTVWPGVVHHGVYANVSSAAVRAAVRGWRSAQSATVNRRPEFIREASRSTEQARLVARLPRTGNIAYSYGVDHVTGALTNHSAGYGHPHPNAVLEYEAHGWFDRRDTPTRSDNSAQPYATAPPGMGARGNAIALGWQDDNQPLQGGGNFVIIRNACAMCRTADFNC